jgi:hypothetical protein
MNQSLVIDFFKATGKLPSQCCPVHSHKFEDPLNMGAALPIAFKLPPEKALDYLKKKGSNIITSSRWDELDAAAHDKAFTVAKVMSADLVQDFYNKVEQAKKEGWPVEKFQKEAMDLADSAGWTGNKLHRLKIIYDTNMQIAYARGKYDKQMLLGKQGIYPLLEYMPSRASHPNPIHELFYHKVLRYDDPFWSIHYAPSRWGCKCWVRSLSEKEARDRGLEITNGSDLIDSIKNNPDLQDMYSQELDSSLNILEVWKPQTDIYVQGIGDKLAEMLKKKSLDNVFKSDNKEKIIEDIINSFKNDSELSKIISESGGKLSIIESQSVGSVSTYLQVGKNIGDLKNATVFKLRLSDHETTEKWSWREKTHEI